MDKAHLSLKETPAGLCTVLICASLRPEKWHHHHSRGYNGSTDSKPHYSWDSEIIVGSLAERNITEECSDRCLETLGSMTPDLSLSFQLIPDALSPSPLSSDLSHLVAEIRALQGSWSRAFRVNNCLRLQPRNSSWMVVPAKPASAPPLTRNFPPTLTLETSSRSSKVGRKRKSWSPQPMGRSL